MQFHNYAACFFAGVALANFVPHFIHGISGNKFPTPFAKPPGEGLSSPTVNMLWSLFNLAIGIVLFSDGYINMVNPLTWLLFFAGVAAMGIMLSIRFQKSTRNEP